MTDRPRAWKTVVAVPLALIVFAVTTVVMAVGFWLWDDTSPFLIGAVTGGCAGVAGGRAAADQLVPGYNRKAVFLCFVLAFAAAFALDPDDEIFRDHWIATACLSVVTLGLAFVIFWRGIDLD